MKRVLSAFMMMVAMIFASAPAALAQDATPQTYCGGNQCHVQNPPSTDWRQDTSVWGGFETFGGAASVGSIVGTGNTDGYSIVNNGGEFNVQNCGTCEGGQFTGRLFNYAEAGQMAASWGEGSNIETRTLAQSMTQGGGELFIGRQGINTPVPAIND